VEIKAPRPASVSQTVRIYAEYVFPKTKFPLFSEFLTAILQEKIFVLILQKEKKNENFRSSSTLHPLFSFMPRSVIFPPRSITQNARDYSFLMGSCSRELRCLRKMYSKLRENSFVNTHQSAQ